jgi:hypothetical protein
VCFLSIFGQRLDTDKPDWQIPTLTGNLCYMIFFLAQSISHLADNQTVNLLYLQARSLI